jgi:oligosaccharyltransferase complex subunit delta (ribophorin II)
VVVTASPKDKTVKRFFLLQNSVEVKVTTLATIVDLQLGIADRDQSAPKLTKLEENKQLSNKLEADQQSKFYLRFGLKDKSKNSFIEAHQAFVRFQEKKSGREIVFLAQPANNQYSAEVDFTTNAKNFRYNSGIYTIELVVADSLIDNPIVWKLADVDVKFIQEGTKSTGVDKASLYAKRPEIKHTFRAPEPTPSPLVSTVFAALCLAPLGLLFLLWLSIGFNFSRFSFSLSGAVFHLSLAAIFGLYYCYWIKLDMFQTLKYLAIIGAVSLVSGSTLLRNLAANK